MSLARAGKRHRAVPPLRLAKEQQRQLVGENLVISEALARVLGSRLPMNLRQCSAPLAPGLAAQKPRLDPFGQLGRAFQRLAHQLAKAAVGEPLGQRIDRLADRRRGPLAGFADLGVDDLPLVAILLELARDGAQLARSAGFASPSRDC